MITLNKEEWICMWHIDECQGFDFGFIEDRYGEFQISGTCFLIHSEDERGEFLKEVIRQCKQNEYICCVWRRKPYSYFNNILNNKENIKELKQQNNDFIQSLIIKTNQLKKGDLDGTTI